MFPYPVEIDWHGGNLSLAHTAVVGAVSVLLLVFFVRCLRAIADGDAAAADGAPAASSIGAVAFWQRVGYLLVDQAMLCLCMMCLFFFIGATQVVLLPVRPPVLLAALSAVAPVYNGFQRLVYLVGCFSFCDGGCIR